MAPTVRAAPALFHHCFLGLFTVSKISAGDKDINTVNSDCGSGRIRLAPCLFDCFSYATQNALSQMHAGHSYSITTILCTA